MKISDIAVELGLPAESDLEQIHKAVQKLKDSRKPKPNGRGLLDGWLNENVVCVYMDGTGITGILEKIGMYELVISRKGKPGTIVLKHALRRVELASRAPQPEKANSE